MCISTLSHRTQLLLDDERHRRLEDEARRTGRSVAAIVREALDARYRLAEQTDDRRRAAAALLGAPRPTDPEPDWDEVERDLLDSRAAPDMP
jgi:predicted DNA-binding protein